MSKMWDLRLQKDKIIEMYKNGMSTRDIAKVYSCNQGTISRLLKEFNIIARTVKQSWEYRKDHYTVYHNTFDMIDTEQKAYWLGFIASDGCVYKNMVCIVLSRKDKKHLEKFAKFIAPDKHISDTMSHNYPMSSIFVTSEDIVKALAEYGIVPRKTYTFNKLPNISKNLMKHFIRGYVDGDGHIGCKPYCRFEIVSYNKSLLEEIQSWLISVLSISEINIQHRKNGNNSFYVYKKTKKQALHIISCLYKGATIYLDRKHELAMKALQPGFDLYHQKLFEDYEKGL